MSADPDPNPLHLSDIRFPRLKIVCARCRKNADYRVSTLRAQFGNPPLEELPRFVAMKAGCALALRFPGAECEARFPHEDRRLEVMLMEARRDGWQLFLRCERHHQALKAAKPCEPKPIELNLTALIAALGHDLPIDNLPRRLTCPGCGTRSFSLSWVVPRRDIDQPRRASLNQ